MCYTSYDFIAGLTISIWTIVQTSFHIIWCLFGYFSNVCKIQPSNYWLVIVYLTYFYNNECGNITIEGDLFTVKKPKKSATCLDIENIDEDEDNVYNIIHTIVKNATLPLESSEAYRTFNYLVIYIFVDGIWIITACLMFTGSYCRIKKCLSLFFYGPWILTTGATIILDTVSSVHFGLDLLQIYSYSTWLKFVGVSNYKDFTKFNDYDSSKYVPKVSPTLMCLLLSRFFIFWIINVYCLFRITNIAILAFREDDSELNPNNKKENRRRSRSRSPRSQGFNGITTEARIRNWQLFYGAVETMSTMSSSSSISSGQANHKSERNSVRTASITPVAQSSQNQEGHLGMGHISPIQEFSEIMNNVSSHYTKFSDVAEDILVPTSRKESTGSLHGQLPWTYVKAPGDQCLSEVPKGSSIQRMKKRDEYVPRDDDSNKTIMSTAL